MDKQQLAQKIWESANNLRGSIEAYEYKDYILGLLFYKFLTDREYEYLKDTMKMTDEQIYKITEENDSLVKHCKINLGYFIEPRYFYRYWIKNINDFTESDLIDALHSYERNLTDDKSTKQVFEGVFDSITRNLSSLASTTNARTLALRNLMDILKDVPTTNEEYDILGYIYEYLISKFAASAGKSSGEFYTPKEASSVIARIIAHNLKGRENIKVLDPAVGSGSLLLAVGNEFEKLKHQEGRVLYYYQDKMRTAYNTCRQNLLMRGVSPSNMIGRNGDTLSLDYPYFSDEDPANTYEAIFVDSVVANPPYSMSYDRSKLEGDVRFNEYGLPPNSKADYAFFLHCLYHLKADGIGAIILPHGVLFRGDEEGKIRQRLVKRQMIDTVIGLAPNMFFGTGIPVCIIIFRKDKSDGNILFIDASKDFVKDGNKNKLRESDIQKIVDAYIYHGDIDKFSRLVSYEEIEANDFNLNISRYINSDPEAESYDGYAVMNGLIPVTELENKFEKVWDQYPSLFDELFEEAATGYVRLKAEDIIESIRNNEEVKESKESYSAAIDNFSKDLRSYLLDELMLVDLDIAQDEIKDKLFDYLDEFDLIDSYEAYEEFSNTWEMIVLDLEEIHINSFDTTKEIKEITRLKKVNGKDEEVFDRFEGQIFPFDLVQKTLISEDKEELDRLNERNLEINSELDNLVEMVDEEDKDKVLNDKGDSFLTTELKNTLNEIFSKITSPEIQGINEYMELLDAKANKEEKMDFMEEHREVSWDRIEKNKDGTVGKGKLNTYYSCLQQEFEFEEDSLGYILSKAQGLKDEESENKKLIKDLEGDLEEKTIETIKNLTDEEAIELLELKWISPINEDLKDLLPVFFSNFEDSLNETVEKYGHSLEDINGEIKKVDNELIGQLKSLTGSASDIQGINDFIEVLGGM